MPAVAARVMGPRLGAERVDTADLSWSSQFTRDLEQQIVIITQIVRLLVSLLVLQPTLGTLVSSSLHQ